MRRFILIITLLLALILSACSGKQPSFSFVQLSDPQLGMGGYEHDVASFGQAISQINQMKVDFAVICGDLVHHASDSSFSDLQQLLDNFEIPVYAVPGNHDVGNTPDDHTLSYYRQKVGKDYYDVYHKKVSFIFTNSQLWKHDIGDESFRHNQWFEQTLSNQSKKSRVVVIGHYPLFVKNVNEEEGYSNLPPEVRKDLLDKFEKHRVRAYLSGHRHELIINYYNGIQLVTGESTSKNFDERRLGFRKWDVYEDTLVHSFVPLSVEIPN